VFVVKQRRYVGEVVERAVGGVKVYVFGSVLTDRYTATS